MNLEFAMKNYLVFDVGGTFIIYALMDDNAVILEKDKVPTPSYEKYGKEDFYRVLDIIAEKYKSQISGIAISMSGMLDSKTGYCVTGGYLTYVCATPVAEELTERLGVPVTVENDGKCAALAEYWKGSFKGYTNAAVVVFGTGIAVGGGISQQPLLFEYLESSLKDFLKKVKRRIFRWHFQRDFYGEEQLLQISVREHIGKMEKVLVHRM